MLVLLYYYIIYFFVYIVLTRNASGSAVGMSHGPGRAVTDGSHGSGVAPEPPKK